MLRIIGTWLGTIASVFGLVYTLWPPGGAVSPRQAAWLTALAVLFIVTLMLDVREHWKRQPKRYKKPGAIVDYMHRWISGGSRVVIFTRDMSWAREPRIRDLLASKAQRSELTVCLPEPIELTDELARHGARIVVYPVLSYVPTSRFTIVNEDRMDARVAIGRQVKGVHVIEEFAAGEHPVFAVAHDLVQIIRRIANEKNP